MNIYQTAIKTNLSMLFIGTLLLLSCQQNKTYFSQLSAAQTGIHFSNTVSDTDSLNIFDYPYLYAGAGVSIGDINNDGLDDIFLVANHKGGNKLYLNKGAMKFEDVTANAGLSGLSDWCTGSCMVDINGDGLLDIYVCTVSIPGKLKSRNELYINLGNGHFREAASEYGLNFSGHATQAAFFDYDRDGDLDCFLLNHGTKYSDDYQTVSVRMKNDSLSGGKLLRNDGGHFVDVTLKANIYCASNEYGLGIAIGDVNNDGWPDVYVSNDFKENDFCYINNGDGTFHERSNELFDHVSRFSMGNDMADYNNDGWPDVLTLDMLSQDEKILKTSLADDDIEVYNYKQKNFGFHYQFSKNCLQQNMQGKHFCDVSLQKGIDATDWSWAPLLADFNNDGWKDLFISNGFKYRTNDLDFTVFSQQKIQQLQAQNIVPKQASLIQYLPAGHVPDYFYIGSANGFADSSKEAGFTQPTLSNGTAYADLDNDGDLDLVVNRMNAEPGIYRNDFNAGNFLSVSLKGNDGNTQGLGAVVYAFTGGQMQCVNQSPVRGFMSSVSPVLHLGLGDKKTIDSLIICWPDGSGETLFNVSANQRIVLQQSKARKEFTPPVLKQYISGDWKKLNDNAGVNFVHHEDDFDDLNVQPLLPHSLATQGPKLAVGDVNNDGLPDFYVCGAKGQPGCLFIQNTQEKFDKSPQVSFAADSLFESTDALFFDADGDGDLDLYVCSGGNEYFGHEPTLPDRLYINNGQGNFSRSMALPNLYENKSCVRACDFDKDGDLDLFVGGRANARMFGYMPSSVILQNNSGVFTENTEAISHGLSNVGMVTDACWSDVDGDGWQDLIVVGEWMAITIFKNNHGHLEKQNLIANSEGLWQTILPADVDGDGDIDYLVGNWGNNTKLRASDEFPLKLFIAEWDKNGETEPVLSTAKGGIYYPFYGKADLEKRLPFLRKRFLQAKDFAGKSMQEVFTNSALDKAQLLKATELKSCLLRNNKGAFSLEPLPAFLQVAPIFSFVQLPAADKQQSFMAGGNFYEVSPYEGRYDALLPLRFSFQKNVAVMQDYLLETAALRQLKTISLGHSNALLLAFNNNPLIIYKQIK